MRQTLVLLLALLGPATTWAAGRANVVILFADDLGYAELGCQGCRDVPTPHIDSLARDGIRFTQGYVTAPFCSPSRAGLLTGRMQTRFGHELNPVGKHNLDPKAGLPLAESTLADALADAGLATGLVGKWHLGGTPPHHPQRRGFGSFFGFLHEGHFYAPSYYPAIISHLRRNEPPYDADNPVMRGNEVVEENAYFTEALTREALSFLDRHQKQPFFLYLAYNAVHSPMQATPKYFDRFRSIADPHRRTFAAMLSALDDSVGAVLGRLRELGLEENTLVVLLSDNGGPTAELTSSNKPLRGGKGQLWEGGIRVPFLMRWKGKLPAGKVENRPVSSLDLFPTALAAVGAGMPERGRLDGANLLPYLAGEKPGDPHEALFWRYGPNVAVRVGDWKLVRQAGGGKPATSFQLFDLGADPGETTDRSAAEPEVARRLHARLDAINAEMVEPAWRPPPRR